MLHDCGWAHMNLKPSKVQVRLGADGAYHCTIVDLAACMGMLPFSIPLLVVGIKVGSSVAHIRVQYCTKHLLDVESSMLSLNWFRLLRSVAKLSCAVFVFGIIQCKQLLQLSLVEWCCTH